jgi:hypothetical protein
VPKKKGDEGVVTSPQYLKCPLIENWSFKRCNSSSRIKSSDRKLRENSYDLVKMCFILGQPS